MEGSKAFAKDFMARWNIPTAEYQNFSDYESARSHLDSVPHKVVLKASGRKSFRSISFPLQIFVSIMSYVTGQLVHEKCLRVQRLPEKER